MRRQMIVLLTVALFVLPCCRSNTSRNSARSTSTSSTSTSSASAPAATEQAAYARLLMLQQEADAAKDKMNHRSLTELAEAMDKLHFATAAYEQQRRELAAAPVPADYEDSGRDFAPGLAGKYTTSNADPEPAAEDYVYEVPRLRAVGD
jgi:hypothetical protein